MKKYGYYGNPARWKFAPRTRKPHKAEMWRGRLRVQEKGLRGFRWIGEMVWCGAK